MKISKIQLRKYLNFKDDLVIDLTYPRGHPKQGQPLEKVCFIGQSSTGKTSILSLIKYFTFLGPEIDISCVQEENLKDGNVEIFYRLDTKVFSKRIKQGGVFDYLENGKEQLAEYEKVIQGEMSKLKTLLIDFPFNIVEKTKKPYNPPGSIPPGSMTRETLTNEQRKTVAQNRKIWDFGIQNLYDFWDFVSNEIAEYKKSLQKEKDKFITNVKQDNELFKESLEKLTEWESKNANPLKRLADKFLDGILAHLNLKTNCEIDSHDGNDLNFIRIDQRNDALQVPYEFLSTGAKQVILTAMPLYYLEPNGAIILFDQPESSLYPDIQLCLVDSYQQLATNCQFFYATHSPIIASAFEPAEIVELYFDEETGKVDQRHHYDEHNGKRNYKADPRLLPWHLIYMHFFAMKSNGNPGKFRIEKFNELAQMKLELEEFLQKGEKVDNRIKKDKLKEIRIKAKELGVNLRSFFSRIDDEENQ